MNKVQFTDTPACYDTTYACDTQSPCSSPLEDDKVVVIVGRAQQSIVVRLHLRNSRITDLLNSAGSFNNATMMTVHKNYLSSQASPPTSATQIPAPLPFSTHLLVRAHRSDVKVEHAYCVKRARTRERNVCLAFGEHSVTMLSISFYTSRRLLTPTQLHIRYIHTSFHRSCYSSDRSGLLNFSPAQRHLHRVERQPLALVNRDRPCELQARAQLSTFHINPVNRCLSFSLSHL